MADLHARGIRAIVDLTTVDLGRDIGLIVDVARRSRVHVIVATGVWWMPQRYFSAHGVDAVAELFIRDITQGIGESGVKAAIIKCATDTAGVTPVIENILRASARAQKATGVPISTHTWAAGRIRRGAAGDLRAGGRRPPPRHHRPQRRQRGPGLSARADGAGQHDRHGPLRPRALPAHREAGRGHRPALRRRLRRASMVLSHDANCWSDMLSEDDKRRTRPLWHYNHISDDILPALRKAGVTEDQIEQMLVGNPRAIFEARGPRSRVMAVILGTGAYRYEVDDDWAKLPPGQEFNADVAAVGVDAQDQVYAFNRGEHPMVVFDREGNFLRSWGEGVFRRAHGVHMAPDDTIWLTDDGDHTVRQCTLDGKVLLTIGIPGKPAPYMSGEPFHRCTHTALSPQGDLYVSDGYGNARVHKYAPDGKLLRSWGEPGTDPGQFNIPHNICCDPDGWVYVADRENHRVQVFDGNGKYETQWNNMHRPSGLYHGARRARAASTSARSAARMAVNYDMPNIGPRVSIYSHQGELLARLGDRLAGLEPGQFISPHGLAVDSRGDIYVGEVSYTNWGNRYKGQPHSARPAQPAEARQGGNMTKPITLQVFSDYV